MVDVLEREDIFVFVHKVHCGDQALCNVVSDDRYCDDPAMSVNAGVQHRYNRRTIRDPHAVQVEVDRVGVLV